jgi:NTP pyrophosphatase (non-canonical NTP hydrolase)
MQEKQDSVKRLSQLVDQFLEERNWKQFHNPKSDAMNVSCEASELAELFIWTRNEKEAFEQAEKLRTSMEEEAGDVLFAILCFCITAGIDPEKAFLDKLEKTKQKYPVEKSSGRDFSTIKYGDKE